MHRFSKRLLIALLSILIAFVGISVSPVMPDDKYADEYKESHYYSELSHAQQANYAAIYNAVVDGFDKNETIEYNNGSLTVGINISFPIQLNTYKEAKEIFTAFWRDNPQFFFVDNRYVIRYFTLFGRQIYNGISIFYSMDAAERARADRALDRVVNSIIEELPDTKDEYIKEYRLHDALISRCEYSKVDNPPKSIYSAYGALVEKSAVCEGYARAMQLLLSRVGIRSSLISGRSAEDGVGHIWNLVTINGRKYHLDPTWNDIDGLPRHVFFNCTNEQIRNTHIIDKQFSSVMCQDTEDNYYTRNCLYLESADEDALIKVISGELIYRQDCIELKFSPDVYKQAQEFLADTKHLRHLVNIEIYFSNYIMWHYTLYSYDDSYVLCLQRR